VSAASTTARRRPALLPALLLAAATASAAGACSEIGTDPNAAVSIAFDSLPALAIVEGDTLRDRNGKVAPLQAYGFNASGDTVRGLPFRYIVRDTSTALEVDAEGRFVVADPGTSGRPAVLLQASLGNLQFTRTLAIVARPDILVPVDDTLAPKVVFSPVPAQRDTNLTDTLAVSVLHDAGSDSTGVPLWLVTFAVDSFDTALIDSVQLTNALGVARSDTTTGSDGVARLFLRVYPKVAGESGRRPATLIVVRASARFIDPLAGSPARIVVPVVVCRGPRTGCVTPS
jgi:hypothetical protein